MLFQSIFRILICQKDIKTFFITLNSYKVFTKRTRTRKKRVDSESAFEANIFGDGHNFGLVDHAKK